jgi:hypothetical protein
MRKIATGVPLSVPRENCSIRLWRGGEVERWSDGVVEWWRGGVVERWRRLGLTGPAFTSLMW